jgi:hypothetical protein
MGGFRMKIVYDLTGQRFGQLAVLEFVGTKGTGTARKRLWRCLCDCGQETTASTGSLRQGKTRSCGCGALGNHRLHGDTAGKRRSTEHVIWSSMLKRCETPTCRAWKNYGGRGIKVCARWHDFAAFLADVGRRPSKAHSLDRVDNDGHYEPGNVRWATRSEQGYNTRVTRWLEAGGKRLTLDRWSKRIGVPAKTIRSRLYQGWPVEAAVTVPLGGKRPRPEPVAGLLSCLG